MPITDAEHLKMLEGSVPISRGDPRRARDFVRCTNQKCQINEKYERHNSQQRRFGGPEWQQPPHCHPVF